VCTRPSHAYVYLAGSICTVRHLLENILLQKIYIILSSLTAGTQLCRLQLDRRVRCSQPKSQCTSVCYHRSTYHRVVQLRMTRDRWTVKLPHVLGGVDCETVLTQKTIACTASFGAGTDKGSASYPAAAVNLFRSHVHVPHAPRFRITPSRNVITKQTTSWSVLLES
jgi:hypothetical protein